MQGVFAIDVAVVVEDDGSKRYVAIECNPRFNGASYPSALAYKLKLPQWFAEQLDTRFRHLSEIDLSGIEFDPLARIGVAIVNWGNISAGKIGVIISGDSQQIEAFDSELRKRL